uniref:Metalloendopeptidase n=1 Tax=Oulactis sp. TaxID=2093647 RepID=A0A4V6IM42_OULSP|nr:mRNA [Oulactis sp. MM-2018]
MVRLVLIVLVALQILLVTSFPADDGSMQNLDRSETDVNAKLSALDMLEDVDRQREDKSDEDLADDLMNEVPNTENQVQDIFNNLPENPENQENEDNDENVDEDEDVDDEREGGEYKEEENLGNSHVVEGDIYKDKSTTEILNALQSGVARDAITSVVRLWPRGRVPYVFGPVSSRVKSAFRQAIQEYNKYSCIRVVPRTSEKDYIYVISGGGCYSSLGKSGGRQRLSLGRGCEHKGIAVHEIMHALGFFHEQSRIDRDNYISIHWANIMPGVGYNFKKYSHGQADTLGEPYDYGSIMHYPRRAFSRNGKETIVPKKSGVTIGQRRGLSRIDIRQLNKLYKCRGGVIPTRLPTRPAPCVDMRTGCPRWAKKQYCVKGRYIQYMRRKCRKSCGLCKGTVSPKCFDIKSSCARWAKAGFCKSKYVSYMNKNCAKTCGKC